MISVGKRFALSESARQNIYQRTVRKLTYSVFAAEFERTHNARFLHVCGINYHIYTGVGDKFVIFIAYQLRKLIPVYTAARIVRSVKSAERHDVRSAEVIERKRCVRNGLGLFGYIVIVVSERFEFRRRTRRTTRKRADRYRNRRDARGKSFIHRVFSSSLSERPQPAQSARL